VSGFDRLCVYPRHEEEEERERKNSHKRTVGGGPKVGRNTTHTHTHRWCVGITLTYSRAKKMRITQKSSTVVEKNDSNASVME
jgi:hypothetical protein